MENLNAKKNAELMAIPEVATLINSGKVVVLGIYDTKNADIKQVALCQKRDDVSTSQAQEVNKVNEMLLGWTNDPSRIVRGIRSFKPSVMALAVGQTLPDGLNLQVEQRYAEPFYNKADGTPQEPRKRPDGSIIAKNGTPIYEQVSVVAGEPKHTLIMDYDRVNTTISTSAFTAPQLAEVTN